MKTTFDREYEEYMLSEVLCQAMKEKNITHGEPTHV